MKISTAFLFAVIFLILFAGSVKPETPLGNPISFAPTNIEEVSDGVYNVEFTWD
ncbi:7016_t:CDS:1, partial [Racocetra persica]